MAPPHSGGTGSSLPRRNGGATVLTVKPWRRPEAATAPGPAASHSGSSAASAYRPPGPLSSLCLPDTAAGKTPGSAPGSAWPSALPCTGRPARPAGHPTCCAARARCHCPDSAAPPPPKVATCWRDKVPSSGSSASRVRVSTGPTPGTWRSKSSWARHSGLACKAGSRSRSTRANSRVSHVTWAWMRWRTRWLGARCRRCCSAVSCCTTWRRRVRSAASSSVC